MLNWLLRNILRIVVIAVVAAIVGYIVHKYNLIGKLWNWIFPKKRAHRATNKVVRIDAAKQEEEEEKKIEVDTSVK